MPKGGQLSLSTASVEIDEGYASRHPGSRPGVFVCLTVADTGCGMDRQTLDRIFEPFFSTKEVGKGTGLGLATAYGIVNQHRGWIEVTSQPGSGTTFKIYFPVTARQNDITGTTFATLQSVRGGKETILLVEDEPMLRKLVREVLGRYEYRVVEADCGIEALKAWDEHDGRIDLLLTDMVMPEGITGSELATQLRKRKPELKVIFTSGYSEEVMGKDSNQSGIAFIAKPYLPPQLAQLVRQSLDNKPRRLAPSLPA
jgi:CheY-like chemotaxis protein